MGAPAAAGGGVRTNNRFPCLLSPCGGRGRASLFLKWAEGRGVSRGRAGGEA